MTPESVRTSNDEVFGPNGTLGRLNDGEVVLTRELRRALEELNPGLPADAYDQAVRRIVETSAVKSLVQINREKYDLYRNGVPVTVKQPDGAVEELRLRVFDFREPSENHFLVVRELWVAGYPYAADPISWASSTASRSSSSSSRTSTRTSATPTTRTWPTTGTPFLTCSTTTRSSC